MKTIDDINLQHWFTDRELDFMPAHFVVSKTPIKPESKMWILEKLAGRFAYSESSGALGRNNFPAFEDPKEALFYELTWG